MFSWSIVIPLPVYGEKHIVVMTSVVQIFSNLLTVQCSASDDPPLVRFMTLPHMSRMSVTHSTPSYPPLTMTVGSSAVSSLSASYTGARTHASARIAD